ncbi:MAG TPA: DNA-packaging protein [Thermoanaerobaculia bacterium]|nr:DNA-packaging protein [Thermoanaerobaculia bacterium]
MYQGALQLITPPAVEPVVLADAKLFLRLDTAADDAMVTALIVAARRRVEAITARALITQVWKYYLDAFPGGDFWSLSRPLGVRPLHREIYSLPHQLAIQVPLPPLQSVASVKYIDPAGILQTLDPTLYTVDAISEPARIVPAYGTWWPLTQAVPNAVQVQFTAGYGADGTFVPAELVAALKLVCATLYENRQTVLIDATAVELPFGADALLMPYRAAMI